MTRLSIIVPTLNEAAGVVGHLAALQSLRRRGVEVIVSDGGSTDGTCALAAPLIDALAVGTAGRGAQMNRGAQLAHGDVLLFLHADTRLPRDADALIEASLAAQGSTWGRFDVAIDGASLVLALVASLMNRRSRLSGIATGDQAIFVRRDTFESIGGFPEIALMEDIALCRRLKRLGPPLCLRERVMTSGRRWHRQGALRTIVLMWRLRLAFALGADPHHLARVYGDAR